MRIALISDLHGNDVALRAVFADIDRRGVDEVICLGDVATLGPRPNEVIARLRERGCRCILGNHDAFMLDPALIQQYSDVPIVVDSVDWCRDRLSRDELDYLAGFAEHIHMELAPGVRAFFYHGTPRSNMEDLLVTMDPQEVDQCLGEHDATVLAGGHTHVQMLRQHRGSLIVNPGSTGMPFREYVDNCAPHVMAHAEYAIVEADRNGVEVHLKRVALDKDRMREEAAACSSPVCRALEVAYS